MRGLFSSRVSTFALATGSYVKPLGVSESHNMLCDPLTWVWDLVCCVNAASGLYIIWGKLHAYAEIVYLALIHVLVFCVSNKKEQVN